MNPDFENFKTSTWPEFRDWISWEHVIERDRRMGEYGWEPSRPFNIHFDNGAEVRCKGLHDPNQARGPNISWMWYDEGARDTTGKAWQLGIAAVRISGPNGEMPAAWTTTTPAGTRHWTARWFVFQDVPEEVLALLDDLGYEGPLYEYFTASIHDNRANLDPLFYASMMSAYVGKWADQELGGLIVDVAEGRVYDAFGPENVSTEAEYDPVRGPVELAYDDGFATSPRVFLFLQVDDDGRVNVFDELYHTRHLGATCVGEAKDMLKGHVSRAGRAAGDERLVAQAEAGEGPARIEIAVGDPSAAELRGCFRQADVVARGASHAVIEGIKNMARLVRNADGEVMLRVHPRCKQFVREMRAYRYPEGSDRRSDVKPLKEDDHGPDALRYWAWLRARAR